MPISEYFSAQTLFYFIGAGALQEKFHGFF